MNKPLTLARLICLTAALAAGPALMTMDASAAENYGSNRMQPGHPASNAKPYGLTPQFVISGQPASVKRVLHHCYYRHHHQECYPRYRPLNQY
jgi:hypothetical protein